MSLMDCTCATHGLLLVSRGLPMGYPWVVHGPTSSAWTLRALPMGRPSTAYVV